MPVTRIVTGGWHKKRNEINELRRHRIKRLRHVVYFNTLFYGFH